jgi:hypothetical protein
MRNRVSDRDPHPFPSVLGIRNKSFGSCFGSGSGLKLVSDPDPVSNPGSGSRSETGQIFFYTKIFTQPRIFKAALDQLCDLATNKVRKKLAIYEDLSYCLCIVYSTIVSVPSSELGPPHPLSRSECVSHPEPKEGRTHWPAGEGVGESQFGRLEKKPSTLSTAFRCPTKPSAQAYT